MTSRLSVCLAALAALVASACARADAPGSARVEADGDAVTFIGRIDAQSAARLIELVRAPNIRRLVITSGGGLVGPALDIGAAVYEHHLEVDVPRACYSSCANYVFPAGRRKVLGRPGAVAWHGDMAHVLYLQQHGLARWSPRELEDARVLALREAAFFERIGVDGFVCWFAKIGPYNVPDFYYLAEPDLARFGIGGVTVMQPATGADTDDERLVGVDWSTLEAIRPVVRLRR